MLFLMAGFAFCVGVCLGGAGFINISTLSVEAVFFIADFFFGRLARAAEVFLYSSSDEKWLRSICSRCCLLNCFQYDVA